MRKFAQDEQPMDYQLTVHFNNLITYFHPNNSHLRADHDKPYWSTIEQMIPAIEALRNDPQLVQDQLTCRYSHPIGFRLAQMISYYGPAKVKYYCQLIYRGVGHGKTASSKTSYRHSKRSAQQGKAC